MFLQNLSTASERKSRKSGGAITKAKNDSVSGDSKPDGSVAPTESTALHTDKDGPVPRDRIVGFLNDCVAKLLDDTTVHDLALRHIDTKTPLFEIMIDYQREVMQDVWRIEKNYGCQFLSRVTEHYADDMKVHQAAKRFMFVAMRSYVNTLRHVGTMRARPLKGAETDDLPSQEAVEGDTGRLPPPPPVLTQAEMFEFFEGCNALMMMPETKKLLKDAFETTRRPPQAAMQAQQESVWEMIGVDPAFGMGELAKVGDLYSNNQAAMMRTQQFMICMQLAGREAMMSETEKKAFYDQIPPLMHNMPHLYVFQMQLMQHQHGGGAHQHGPHCRHNHSHDHGPASHNGHGHDGNSFGPAEVQKIQSMMTEEGTKDRMQALGTRIATCKGQVEGKVSSWSAAERQSFFDSFSDSQVVEQLNSVGSDPVQRLELFLAMNDTDLESLLTLQTCVALDAQQGGSMAARMGQPAPAASGGGGVLGGLISGLGALTGLGGSKPAAGHSHDHSHGHSHDHGHGHTHSASCSHGAPAAASGASLSGGQTMDR